MPRKSLRERFDAKVAVDDTSGCWIWTAACDTKGYGRINVGGKPAKASRVSYTLFRGPIPEGQVLDHYRYPEGGCAGPRCVNPSHLLATTRSENSARNSWKRRTQCAHGHPYDAENTAMVKTGKGRLVRRCKACRRARAKKHYEAKRAGKKAPSTVRPTGKISRSV